MKKVTLRNYSTKDKGSIYTRDHKNCVSLGNGASVSFTSEKQCRAFIVLVNKELNVLIDDLNLLYIDLFREYRFIWRSLKADQAGRLVDLVADIGRLLSRACEKSGSPNANHFTFHYLIKSCEFFQMAFELLSEQHARLNNWHAKRMINAMEKRIMAIKLSLGEIGKK